MKCLFWNIRGARRTSFSSSTRTLVKLNNIDICVFLNLEQVDKAISIAKKLGFSNYHLEEAKGFSGGIWFCWNKNVTNLEIIFSTPQAVMWLSI